MRGTNFFLVNVLHCTYAGFAHGMELISDITSCGHGYDLQY